MSDSIDLRRILNPDAPREIAQTFAHDKFWEGGMRSLQCVASSEEFFAWEDSVYRCIAPLELKSILAKYLSASWKKKKGQTEELIVPFNPKSSQEREIIDSLKNICCEGIKKDPSVHASWIFLECKDDLPDPTQMIPFKNKLLSIDQFLKDGDPFTCLHDISPRFFCSNVIPFDIDPRHCRTRLPEKFLRFLNQVFSEDESSIQFLRQWMGYCLTSMTWAQKILLMIGPKRSGKGTIARIIQTMLGADNVIAPLASSMITNYGMEPWIGKRLAIFGDARFGDNLDKDAVKEYLLQISGEDWLTIPRKFKSAVSTKLLTRIMILSNEIPSIRDSGAALASRFMVLKMEKSFIGKEDTELFERDLKPEIPLIFWWALDGLRDLMAVKRFKQPETGQDSVKQLELYQSPVNSFVEERCSLHAGYVTPKYVLYNAYESWCRDQCIEPLFRDQFFKQLLSAISCLKEKRCGMERIYSYVGIGLTDRVQNHENL